jgi:hypothetical protein
MSAVRSRRRRVVTVLAGLVAGALAATGLAVGPAQAYLPNVRVDLRVLVVDDGSPGVGVLTAQMSREGVPFTTVNLNDPNRPQITTSFLSDTVGGVPRSKYQGVVLPNDTALAGAELTALVAVEQRFGIRQIDAYVSAYAGVGLSTTWSGTMDGGALSVTAAGKADGFGYLAGSLNVDDRDPAVSETWGYLGAPAAGVTFTPLVTGTSPDGSASGSLMGVYAHDSREELAVTLAENQYQGQAEVLGHGLLTWLTRGVHLGYWRNYFSVHVDDVLLPDDQWDSAANCTVGDNCNPTSDPTLTPYDPPIRMTPTDVNALISWQTNQNYRLNLVFNGGGSVDAGGANDPLTTALKSNAAKFSWINHTYSHEYLGCVQDFSVTPWRCATDPTTGAIVWVSQQTIQQQISQNVSWARQNGIPINAAELVTGEHSGLASLPQMPTDNPNLAPALSATGVTAIASDASREPAPRTVGPARTVPRHPTNIYYNVDTAASEVDEYNWIYTSQADGGSGLCQNNPTSTCIAPLDPATGFASYIVPKETQIAFDHVATNDPEPHYVHQSNLTGDRIAYPLLTAVLSRYRATFTAATPLVNPTFTQISVQQSRQAAWPVANPNVEAYVLNGRVTVINHGATAAVPITVPAGTHTVTLSLLGIELDGGLYGSAYGPEQSAWTTLGTGATQLLRLP